MARDRSQSWEKLTNATCYVDSPAAGANVYAECITVAGWLHAPGRDPSRCRIRGWIDGEVVGETRLLFSRPDVCAALGLPESTPTGFRFTGFAGDGSPRNALLLITASWGDEDVEAEVARISVRLLSANLGDRPYGDVLHPSQAQLLHREHVYGSGPPVEEPSAETSLLIRHYLGARSKVLDVGCGGGAYGPALIAAGHDWLGLEVNPACCDILRRRDLPHRQGDGETGAFPCGDGEFDDAICIEVLEHIADTEKFLSEMARVVRKRALFSVPNIEVIPSFSAWQVVPWHLLEADHKNFFTRSNLRQLLLRHFRQVEVFSYGEHPLRTPDGLPLHVHLFAVADK